jgi:hypothetical protein
MFFAQIPPVYGHFAPDLRGFLAPPQTPGAPAFVRCAMLSIDSAREKQTQHKIDQTHGSALDKLTFFPHQRSLTKR